MVIVERQEDAGDYLKAAFVIKENITYVTIINAGEITTYTPKDTGVPVEKLCLGITIQEASVKEAPTKWTLNNSSHNALFDLFGKDTQKWVDKKIEITTQSTGKIDYITVDKARTARANPTQEQL